ncbi:hypothetical protein F5I97DRAFT_1931544 [Phlebopus sp. FC_14]|nr:hypothetical protein F5I97DRAFT_1931544 [Phlebopus sp. FC_14]
MDQFPVDGLINSRLMTDKVTRVLDYQLIVTPFQRTVSPPIVLWAGEVTTMYDPTFTKSEDLAEAHPSLDLIFIVGIDEVRPWTDPKRRTSMAIALRWKPYRRGDGLLPERTLDKRFALSLLRILRGSISAGTDGACAAQGVHWLFLIPLYYTNVNPYAQTIYPSCDMHAVDALLEKGTAHLRASLVALLLQYNADVEQVDCLRNSDVKLSVNWNAVSNSLSTVMHRTAHGRYALWLGRELKQSDSLRTTKAKPSQRKQHRLQCLKAQADTA